MNEYLERLEAEIPLEPYPMGRPQFDQFPGLSDTLRGQKWEYGEKYDGRPRWYFIKKYSFAIPDDRAIETIAKHSPIVEMGAGTGYWAYLLAEAGADVIAYDAKPPSGKQANYWFAGSEVWFPVRRGYPYRLAVHPDRALFLCWPSMSEGWVTECLDYYKGDTLIYIGEDEGGCTANDEFFHRRDEEWTEVGDGISIPQWSGIHDYLSIWRRNG